MHEDIIAPGVGNILLKEKEKGNIEKDNFEEDKMPRKGRDIKIYGTEIKPKSVIVNHKKYYLAEAYLTKERAERATWMDSSMNRYHCVVREAESFKPAWCVYVGAMK